MSKNKRRQVYWHYTTLDRYTLIYRDRLITPATGFVIPPERPAVWFSCHPHWEPTANKGIMEGGLVRTATMDEMEAAGGGLVRIGVERRHLPYGWDGYPRTSGVLTAMAEGLYWSALAVGANPRDWRISYNPVPIEQWCEVQVLVEGRWVGTARTRGAA